MAEDMQDNQKSQPGYEGYLNDRVAALPEVLQDNGYHTLMSGKWHLGLTPDRWPCRRGFDRSYTLLTVGWPYPTTTNADAYPTQGSREPLRLGTSAPGG